MGDLKKQNLTGLQLSKLYYEQYGIPMIKEQFSDYEDKIAVGLIGEGSDCYGYDDEISRDHDWGPDFCLFITKDTYEKTGEQLAKAYSELPKEFEGYKRTTMKTGAGRRGVLVIEDYFENLLGVKYDDEKIFDVNNPAIKEYSLSAATNGSMFRDDEGFVSKIRNHLVKGYSEQMRLLKIAEDVANFSQNAQYNYFRMLERDDYFTANIMLSQGFIAAMKLLHHFYGLYTPHDKWLRKSTELLPNGKELVNLLHMASVSDKDMAKELIEEVGAFFANLLYEKNDISDIDSYLDHHVEELVIKAGLSAYSNEELALKIAELEFKAFDQVQNEGGRASCQNNWPTFRIMRMSQYLTWNRMMLLQYYYDFDREFSYGHNLITEKYGRMMESTAPEKYDEIKSHFPELSDEKKTIIEQIVGIQMNMVEELAKEFPKVVGNARSLHTYEDNIINTSYETYLRGEISTYSDKMLQLYGQYVVAYVQSERNLAKETMENTAILYGYEDLASFDASI